MKNMTGFLDAVKVLTSWFWINQKAVWGGCDLIRESPFEKA